MAAIIKCDVCSAAVPHIKAKHIRIHRMSSATAYYAHPEQTLDACDKCCKGILSKRKEVGKADDN